MKLTKADREMLRNKYGGKCAYCGCDLNDRWQADHVEPVRRIYKWVKKPNGYGSKMVPTGAMERPEHDHIGNMVPACMPCNNDKHASTLEEWRRRLNDLAGICQRNYSACRHAMRFGLITLNPKPVVFYFEQLLAEEKQSAGVGAGGGGQAIDTRWQ